MERSGMRRQTAFGPAMTVLAAVLLVSVYGLALTVHPHRGERKAEQKQVEALEEEWRQGMLQADASKLDKLMADDFLGISANGMLSNKAQYLNKVGTRRYSFTKLSFDEMKVRIRGELAIVTALVQVDGQLDGDPQVGTFRYTRVYRLIPGTGWRVINFEATRVSNPPNGSTDMRKGVPLPK
jgi:ketosteroid isomerase-like protein